MSSRAGTQVVSVRLPGKLLVLLDAYARRQVIEKGGCVSYKRSEALRDLVLSALLGVEAREGKVCIYCGQPKSGSDHIVPTSRGGKDIAVNRVPACTFCNSSKRNQLPSEWRDDLTPEVLELEKIAITFHEKIMPCLVNYSQPTSRGKKG